MGPVVTQLAGQRVFPGAHRSPGQDSLEQADGSSTIHLFFCAGGVPVGIYSSPGASTAKVGFIPEVRVKESKLRDEDGWGI